MKLHLRLSGIFVMLIMTLMITAGCDGTSYSNTFTINDTVYDIQSAKIIYLVDERYIELDCYTTNIYLGFEINNQPGEIPGGKWQTLNDTDFIRVSVDGSLTSDNYDLNDTYSGSVSIGGKDGGDITISGSFDFVTGGEHSIEVSYKGPYDYVQND